MVQTETARPSSRTVARALALLVDRLTLLGPSLDALREPGPVQNAVREALRQLTARSRDSALLCRVMGGQLVLDGVPLDGRVTADDPLLGSLLPRLIAQGIGGITVRQGASPGELLTLARLLARSPRDVAAAEATASDTPTTMHALLELDEAPRELLRSWSVLVTPAPRSPSAARDAMSSLEPMDGTGTLAGTLTRLAASRTDAATASAVTQLLEVLAEAHRRGDGVVIEHIARACMTHLYAVGGQGGRIALETAFRHLLQRGPLDLLVQRLPHAADRRPLLQLLARGGDVTVDALVHHLMTAQEPQARRAYFDSIIAMDLGSTALFDALRDARWFVVRNAAALLGEMGVEQADVAMLPLLTHTDDRIRIATARALLRLGTIKALHGLHGVVEDPNGEVRRISAAAYGLAGSAHGGMRPPAARLAMALERETDEDVALEMLASLGKLGSADAIQRLLRIAQPQSTQTSDLVERQPPRESWMRIAALEALVRARGHAMIPAIEGLINDADPEVAEAAGKLRAKS